MFAVLRKTHGSDHWDEIHNSFATRDEALEWLEQDLFESCPGMTFRIVRITDEFIISKVLTRV